MYHISGFDNSVHFFIYLSFQAIRTVSRTFFRRGAWNVKYIHNKFILYEFSKALTGDSTFGLG